MAIEYVKLSKDDPSYASKVARLEQVFKAEYPRNNLSINEGDGFVWIKTVSGHGVVCADYATRAQHEDKVVSDVCRADWHTEQDAKEEEGKDPLPAVELIRVP